MDKYKIEKYSGYSAKSYTNLGNNMGILFCSSIIMHGGVGFPFWGD